MRGLAWVGIALSVGYAGMFTLSNLGWVHLPPPVWIASTVAVFAELMIQVPWLLLSSRRPGFFDIGVSARGLSIRFPLRARTFPWSDLVWYNDRMRVEGKSGWRGPSLVALTPAQFRRVQRWFFGR